MKPVKVESEPCDECGVDTLALLKERDTLKAKLDEYEAVHAWCDKNVDRIDLYRNPDRVCVELWENLSTVPSFTAPTLYEALRSAWERREK